MSKNLSYGLTSRQIEVFLFIDQFLRANGFAPSIRDIASSFKMAASSALDHLRALEKKGFIRRLPHRPRCLEILRKDFGE